jgi:hypothetical protein
MRSPHETAPQRTLRVSAGKAYASGHQCQPCPIRVVPSMMHK